MPLHRRRGYTGREGGEEEEKGRIRAVKMARKEAENERAENLACDVISEILRSYFR